MAERKSTQAGTAAAKTAAKKTAAKKTAAKKTAAGAPAEDPPAARVRLVNMRAQPVELHLADGVRVLAAGQDIELDAGALAAPQVAHLLHRKALAAQAVQPPVPDAADGDAASHPRRRGPGAATTARPSSPPKRKKGS